MGGWIVLIRAQASGRLFEADTLLREHADYWLGGLADHPAVELEWRWGYLDAVELGGSDGWIERDLQTIRGLHRLPSACVLRRLSLRGRHQDYARLLDELSRHPQPSVRTLQIGEYDQDVIMTSDIHIPDLVGLAEIFPRLTQLRVHGRWALTEPPLLPQLRALLVESGNLPVETVGDLLSVDWPELARISIGFGAERYGGNAGVRDLEPLLSGDRFPKVRSLGITNAEFSNAFVVALVNAPIAWQIEELDLYDGTLDDEGAEMLARNIEVFPMLKSLNVAACALSDEGIRRLSALGLPELCVSHQTGRYVTLAE